MNGDCHNIYRIKEFYNPDPLERLLHNMVNYNPIMLSIMRTDDMRSVYKDGNINVSNLAFSEYLLCNLIALKGNIKRFDSLYCIKQKNFETAVKKPGIGASTSMMDKEYKIDYMKIMECLSKNVLKMYDILPEKLDVKLCKAFRNHLRDIIISEQYDELEYNNIDMDKQFIKKYFHEAYLIERLWNIEND
jgi:hypothetical protein